MTFTGTLRPFQALAVDRIEDNHSQLIGYDMGLGKTVVSICAIEELVETKKVKTGFVVVPASLKYQWAEKIEEFTGECNYVVIDGTPEQRAKQYEQVRDKPPLYTILNYEKIRDEWPVVSRLPRDFLCLDEITVCKGFQAKISKRMKRLEADYEWGLTGQPIENRPEDLFSIMEVIDPSVLGRWDLYERTFIVRDEYGRVEREKNLPVLWDAMQHHMVRKTRHDPDVAPYMPQVEESDILIEMDPATRRVYKEIAISLRKSLADAVAAGESFDIFATYSGEGSGDNLTGEIMSKLTALRMLCDHPDLVRLSARLYNTTTTQGSEYAAKVVDRGLLDKITRTPKMSGFLDNTILNLQSATKTKVVVFSTFKATLKWLQASLAAKGFESVIFDGDMSAKQKDAAKREFSGNPRCRVFLSSDAGGYGVDLPNANYLKNYDLPWSAGRLAQRNARIIRLSSEFDKVHVENYLIKDSIEERQHSMLKQKGAIAAAMVDQKGADVRGQLVLGIDSLTKFLDAKEL